MLLTDLELIELRTEELLEVRTIELLVLGAEELRLVRTLLLIEEALELAPLHTDPVTGGR